MKLAFVGFGAFGHYVEAVTAELAEVERGASIYFDDSLHSAGAPQSRPFAAHCDDAYRDYTFYVCLGYRHLKAKREIVQRLVELGRIVPPYVHPSSYVHPSVKLGRGAFVYPGCSIDRETTIGIGVGLGNGCVIAHNCRIDDACWFGASVSLSGDVSVGACSFIASGSVVANGLRVGTDVVIGLGTCVTKSVGDRCSVIGNPMRVLSKPLRLD
jgi:sugar O-acyltransferase (sialic acid O-acetyltransferase NeuD family)